MAYRRNKLPHLQPVGATFSVLLLVHDAVPKEVLRRIKSKRDDALQAVRRCGGPTVKRDLAAKQAYFDKELDRLLRLHATQEHPLANPAAAQLVVDKLKQYDGQLYDLYAYSVMSNHVHLEIDTSVQLPQGWTENDPAPGFVSLSRIMNLIKGGSARAVNLQLGRTGRAVWGGRYRDRFIRSEKHLSFAVNYTLNNPVKAGLVDNWSNHCATGGMPAKEIAAKASRRYFPSATLWIQRLAAYDEAKRTERKEYLPYRRGWNDV